MSHQANDAFVAVNRLLKAGEKVFWLNKALPVDGKTYPAGTFYIPAKASTATQLERLTQEVGLTFVGLQTPPKGEVFALRPVRIGLWDCYGGSMPSGWVRWLLEQFEFPFDVVYPPRLDKGDLNSEFDVLIFVNGAIPGSQTREMERFWSTPQPKPESIPAEYRDRLGRITRAKTIPQLMQFLKGGGTVLTIGSSTSLAEHAGLPVENALLEKLPDGSQKPLPNEKYFIPGSILQTRVDNTHPLAHGMFDRVDVIFNRSPVFRLKPEASRTAHSSSCSTASTTVALRKSPCTSPALV